MSASMSAPGASTQMSLKSVTVSARVRSGPLAFIRGTSESSLTRMVAESRWNAWNTSTGTPLLVASMRKKRAGSSGEVVLLGREWHPRILWCPPDLPAPPSPDVVDMWLANGACQAH